MSNLDHQFFIWINSLAGQWAWLDVLGLFLAVNGIFVLIGAAVMLAIFQIHHKHFAVAFFSSLLSSYAIVKIIKYTVNRARPFEVLPQAHLLIPDFGSGQAFSSGHAAVLFSIAFSFYGTKFFWPFVAWASLCSFARIFIGVHYPADILASVVISAFVVWGVRRLFKTAILR